MSGGDLNEGAAAPMQPLLVEMKTEQGLPTIIQMLTPHGVMQMQPVHQVPSSSVTVTVAATSAISQPPITSPLAVSASQLEAIQRALLQQVLQPGCIQQQALPVSTQDAPPSQPSYVQIQLMKEQIEQQVQQFQAEQAKAQSKQHMQKQQQQQQQQQQQHQHQLQQQKQQQQQKSQKLVQKHQLQPLQMQHQEQLKNEEFPSLVSQLQSGGGQVTQIEQLPQLHQLQATYQLQAPVPSTGNQFQMQAPILPSGNQLHVQQINADLGSIVKLATQDVDVSQTKFSSEYQAAPEGVLAPTVVETDLGQPIPSSSVDHSTLTLQHADLQQVHVQAEQLRQQLSNTSQQQLPHQVHLQLANSLTSRPSQNSSNLIPIAIRRLDQASSANTMASGLSVAAPSSIVLQPLVTSISTVPSSHPSSSQMLPSHPPTPQMSAVSLPSVSGHSAFFPTQTFASLSNAPLPTAAVTTQTFASNMASSLTPSTTTVTSVPMQTLSLRPAQSPMYPQQTSTPIPSLDRPIPQPVLHPGKILFDDEDRMTAASLLLNNLAQGGGTDDSTKTEGDESEDIVDVSSMHAEELSPVALVHDLTEKSTEVPGFETETGFNDSLLWCYDCGALVRVYCRQHGSLSRIRDRVIPPRAKLTTPHHVSVKVLELRAGGDNVFGVFAKKVIQKRSQFGPFEGDLVPECPFKNRDDKMILKLIHKDGTSEFYDNTNQNLCNWLMYIRPAANFDDQNLIAYQFRGKLYFASIKTIAPNDELKVWYAENYRQALNAEKLKATGTDNYTELVSTQPVPEEEEESGNKDFDDIIADNEEYRQQMGMDNSVSLDVSVNFLTRPFELPPADPPEAPLPMPPVSSIQTVADGEEEEEEEEAAAPEEVDEVEEEEDNDRWTCSACSAQFNSLARFDAHDCETKVDTGRRTRSKRKGHPVKRDLEVMDVKQPSKRTRGRSRRSGASKTLPASPKMPKIPPDESACHPSSPGSLPQTAALHESPVLTGRTSGKLQPAVSPVRRKPEDGSPDEHKPRRKVSKPSAPLFRCTHCTMAFSTMGKLKMHTYTHTGERPFRCSFPDCDKAFTSKFKQIRHELIHTGSKKHTCPYCQKNFSRKDHLKNHLRVHDPHKLFHKCKTCEKEYASPFAFKTHLAFHAAEEGELTCLVCKEEFTEKLPLVVHLKIHAGARSVKDASEKNQKCPLCNKSFFTRKDVKRHLVVHTKDRDFLCQFCPQRFGRRDHLVRHLKKAHTNESSGMALTDLTDDLMVPLPTTQVPALPDPPSDSDGQSQIVTDLLQTVARSILDSPASMSQSPQQQSQQQTNANLMGLIKMKTEEVGINDPSTLNVTLPVSSLPPSIANLPTTTVSAPASVASAAANPTFLNYGLTAPQMQGNVRTLTLPAGFTMLRQQAISAIESSQPVSEPVSARQSGLATQTTALTGPIPTPTTVGSVMSKLDPPISVQMAGSSPAVVQGITLPAGHELIQTPQGQVVINYTLKTVLDQYTSSAETANNTTSNG